VSALKAAVRVYRRIADVGREAWDACAGPSNPFVSFDFLDVLEQSGCASDTTGWAPHHLTVEDEAGEVACAMPLYLKSHSQGEYVFDWAWADAYERAGGRYYPKAQCAAPFSPVTGPRLLVRAGVDVEEGRKLLLDGALTLTQKAGASSLHVTFPNADEWRFMGEQGMLLRQDQQYHWVNDGYRTFDDFLGALSSSRRKTILRERREAQMYVEITALTGADLSEDHWDAFYGFYMDTGARKWGQPYLNRSFFSLLGERMAHRVLLIMARREGQWVAGALNLIGEECLFGRNWGAVEDIPFLHFELCYYQAIEQAIGRGLKRVEAGAQGPHKIARGYLPRPVYSAHWIADPALREPVARYLEQERRAIDWEMGQLEEAYSPFKSGG